MKKKVLASLFLLAALFSNNESISPISPVVSGILAGSAALAVGGTFSIFIPVYKTYSKISGTKIYQAEKSLCKRIGMVVEAFNESNPGVFRLESRAVILIATSLVIGVGTGLIHNYCFNKKKPEEKPEIKNNEENKELGIEETDEEEDDLYETDDEDDNVVKTTEQEIQTNGESENRNEDERDSQDGDSSGSDNNSRASNEESKTYIEPNGIQRPVPDPQILDPQSSRLLPPNLNKRSTGRRRGSGPGRNDLSKQRFFHELSGYYDQFDWNQLENNSGVVSFYTQPQPRWPHVQQPHYARNFHNPVAAIGRGPGNSYKRHRGGNQNFIPQGPRGRVGDFRGRGRGGFYSFHPI